jgi:type I restriction enzyme M protein
VQVSDEVYERYLKDYGEAYRTAQEALHAAKGKAITSLFTLPKRAQSKIKTEILFIERCLTLLKPGGRLGIVLPEGVFNNPSLQYVREFCEDRAFIRAVVSLPQETFYSSGATVKTSLLFLQKFTVEEQAEYERTRDEATSEVRARYAEDLAGLERIINEPNATSADFLPKGKDAKDKKPSADERSAATEQAKQANRRRVYDSHGRAAGRRCDLRPGERFGRLSDSLF